MSVRFNQFEFKSISWVVRFNQFKSISGVRYNQFKFNTCCSVPQLKNRTQKVKNQTKIRPFFAKNQTKIGLKIVKKSDHINQQSTFFIDDNAWLKKKIFFLKKHHDIHIYDHMGKYFFKLLTCFPTNRFIVPN